MSVYEGGYYPSFPDEFSVVVDEFNVNIKDNLTLLSGCDEALQQNSQSS